MSSYLISAAALASASVGEITVFEDWIVGCDNVRSCRALVLMSENEGDDNLIMVIDRDAGPVALPRISLTARVLPSARPVKMTLAFDQEKKRVRLNGAENDLTVTKAKQRKFFAKISRATSVSLVDQWGKAVAVGSLRGATAAFSYMDERQGRAGTVTALVLKGKGAASAVPVPQAAPIVKAPAIASSPPRALSDIDMLAINRDYGLGCKRPNYTLDVVHTRLDERTTLAVVGDPCGSGGGGSNPSSFAFLIDEEGHVSKAMIENNGDDPTMANMIAGSWWDTKNHLLGSFGKSRGLGDCGQLWSYAWDGAMFRIVKEASMPDCRGSYDYITTYRATVKFAREIP